MQLNSSIVAPDCKRSCVACFFSNSVIPSGKATKEEPPPDTKKITRSFIEQLSTSWNIALLAFTLSLFGNGCPEKNIWNFLSSISDLKPFGITTIPREILILSDTYFAIVSAALPYATTKIFS